MSRFRLKLLIAAACFAAARVSAGDDAVDYVREVKLLLTEHCYRCHGALKQESELRLDTARFAIKGGSSGAAVVPREALASLLLKRVSETDDDQRMPPEGEPLTAKQIEVLRRWIDQGALSPADEKPQPDVKDHWAFQRPVASSAIDSKSVNVAAHRNPIDVLMAIKHSEQNVKSAPQAEASVLLRRVYLDLIGLPPTREQLAQFLADEAPNSYERAVNQLLASPQYGERWGRHWMDVWRYADWSGEVNNQVRGSPQHIWRWRDWIVESLNQDVGYDQMIREMIAADEIAPDDQSKLRATGFLARNWYPFNRNVWLDDTIEHTSKAFLGLTFNCAKCHDHKYDPISQQNYYEFRAFFEPHDIRTDPLPGQKDVKQDGLVRVFDAKPTTPTFLFERGIESQPVKSNPLSPNLPAVLGELPRVADVSVSTSGKALLPSTGRRLALANWLASSDNPLTARVAVNHIWLRHFEAPLVNDVTDFGLRSPRPELADVLDTLAVEFMQNGWSMKSLHRRIVMSQTYRMSSTFSSPANSQLDPDNKRLWKMNHRRMEGETIRDSVLHLAGTLDTTLGGREIPLDESDASLRRSIYFRHGHERQVEFLKMFDGASVLECYRRNSTIVPQQALALSNSVVIREQSRLLAAKLGSETQTDREFTQAVFVHLLSRQPSEIELDRCAKFLGQQTELLRTGGLTYDPSAPESKAKPAEDPKRRAREGLVHVLFNHNDFVTIR